MRRSTFNLVYLCCVSWPEAQPGRPPAVSWSAPPVCLGNGLLSAVAMGALLAPWALLKGIVVSVLAALFSVVGALLIVPMSLARAVLRFMMITVSSKTMSKTRRFVSVLLWLPLVALWLPVSIIAVVGVILATFVNAFLLAVNATYSAFFYQQASDLEDPLEIHVPKSFAGKLFFGCGQAFEYVVDTAEWGITYYLDYVEPLFAYWTDPGTHKQPLRPGSKPLMRVATLATDTEGSKSKVKQRVQVDQAYVEATKANIMYGESSDLDSTRDSMPKYGEEPVPEGLMTFSNPLSMAKRISDGSQGSQGSAVNIAVPWSPIPRLETPRTLSHTPAAGKAPLKEWNLVKQEAGKLGDPARSSGHPGALEVTVDVTGGPAGPSPCTPPPESPSGLSQRGFGEWGLTRAKTYGPCDARKATPAASTQADSSWSCPRQIAAGSLAVTILHNAPSGVKGRQKLWRYCPDPRCYSSNNSLPAPPESFPIDRLARVTVFEQLQLEKADINFYCT